MYGEPAALTGSRRTYGRGNGAGEGFHEGTTLLGTASLDGHATAVFSGVSTLSAGTHTLTANPYNGDVSFPASASNPVTLSVTQPDGHLGGVEHR